MPLDVAQAIVDEAHARGMKVVGHSHRPNEIRVGLQIGIDNFEHTGLTTAPGYPDDIMELLKESLIDFVQNEAFGPIYVRAAGESEQSIQTQIQEEEPDASGA